MVKYYDIHGLLGMEWYDPLFSVVPDFACKYHYFERPAPPERCPVVLEIHSGAPPAERTRELARASERFEVADRIFASEFQHGRMRWKAWVADLETDRVKIWYDFPWYHRLQWPWPCFPDYMIGFQVIEPLIEYKLQERGTLVLHAGAFELDGRVVLLSGRGGVHKTTCLMEALKRGGRYFADDLVILKDRVLHPYPLCDTFFDYFYLHEATEQINRKSMFGAFLHVRRGRKISFPVASPAPVTEMRLILGHREAGGALTASALSPVEFLERVCAVDKLERLSLVDEEEATGRFMLQFNQVYGNDCWNNYWRRHLELLTENLTGVPGKVIFSDEFREDDTAASGRKS